MRQRDYFHPPLQALVKFLRAGEFAARAEEMGGYDLADSGSISTIKIKGNGTDTRELHVVVSTTGAVRMCDAAVTDSGDPRKC